ncbi:hypothetical protein BN1723_013653 [Verticillium longisporum]|uniref:Phosphatidylinositol N-acetylglucosaminyltransferase subunit H conserved domain-containing protein n=1 Tax=Verticillium longisporum TaxID=100787 RepID=A0A0G4LUB8_VERLO|nr:hypothetical protein BN1723_013653 [Verticillium longisporum]
MLKVSRTEVADNYKLKISDKAPFSQGYNERINTIPEVDPILCYIRLPIYIGTMLTTTPYLLIRRPSPTTVEFTVTTRPPTTLPLRLALLALVPLRLVVGGFSLLFLWSIYLLSPYALPAPSQALDAPLLSPTTLLRALHNVALSPPGLLARRLAAATPLALLLPTAVVLLWASLRRVHKTESLLVLRGLGIQTSSSAGSYLAGTATRFIPTEKIRDVLVNEAFRGFEVRHYLVVVVEGEGELVVCHASGSCAAGVAVPDPPSRLARLSLAKETRQFSSFSSSSDDP